MRVLFDVVVVVVVAVNLFIATVAGINYRLFLIHSLEFSPLLTWYKKVSNLVQLNRSFTIIILKRKVEEENKTKKHIRKKNPPVNMIDDTLHRNCMGIQ